MNKEQEERKQKIDQLTYEYLKELAEDSKLPYTQPLIEETVYEVRKVLSNRNIFTRYPVTNTEGVVEDFLYKGQEDRIKGEFGWPSIRGYCTLFLLNGESPISAYEWYMHQLKKSGTYPMKEESDIIVVYDDKISMEYDSTVFKLIEMMNVKSKQISYQNILHLCNLTIPQCGLVLLIQYPDDDPCGKELFEIARKRQTHIVACIDVSQDHPLQLSNRLDQMDHADVVYLFEKTGCMKIKDRRENN